MPQSTALILDAAMFAASAHAGQRRKHAGNEPYINHAIAVAREVAITAGVDNAAVVAAALLHDVLEDSDTTAAELAERFGASVAEMVVECTDDTSIPKKERKALQVEHAPTISPGAKLIKLADKLCNVRDIRNAPEERWSTRKRQRYLAWANDVVTALGQVNESLERAYWTESRDAASVVGEFRPKEKKKNKKRRREEAEAAIAAITAAESGPTPQP